MLRRTKFLMCCTLGWLICGFGSCTSLTLQEACGTRFEQFNRELAHAKSDLETEIASIGPARKLASGQVQLDEDQLERLDPWKDWARVRLKEIEKYIDVLDEDPALKPSKSELSAAADQLVAFHGYVLQGKLTRMQKSLDLVATHSANVQRAVCSTPAQKLTQK